MNSLISLAVVAIVFTACGERYKQKGDAKYISDIIAWKEKRINSLKSENGWLNLTGLYWLKNGENRFGGSKDNDIIFSDKGTPAYIGKFILKDSIVTVQIDPSVEVTTKGEKVNNVTMINDRHENLTVMEFGSLRWFVIKRGERYGIRLRNLKSPLVTDFPGIESYPINDNWKIEAAFNPYNPEKEISVPNILGEIEIEKSPGYLSFVKDNKEFKLDVLDAGKSYFVIFADMTSGKETYGAGRFLYVDKPDSSAKIFIDFNKAYNPPCAFTKYATCPLPPKQNHIKLEITAGEKNFHTAGH